MNEVPVYHNVVSIRPEVEPEVKKPPDDIDRQYKTLQVTRCHTCTDKVESWRWLKSEEREHEKHNPDPRFKTCYKCRRDSFDAGMSLIHVLAEAGFRLYPKKGETP